MSVGRGCGTHPVKRGVERAQLGELRAQNLLERRLRRCRPSVQLRVGEPLKLPHDARLRRVRYRPVVAGTSFGINICWNERTGCDCEISIGMSSDGSLLSSSEFVVVDMSVAAESVLGWKWFFGGLKRATSGAGRRSRD